MSQLPGVFLSHSHFDRHFVKRLAGDLRRYGVNVWVDEAEMLVGDSLIEKIRDGIDSMDYVLVVISRHSVKSAWVRREIDVAMTQEIEGRRVKVLPILLDDCDLPGFLMGKLYADFRKPVKYNDGLEAVLKRLGIQMYASPMLKDLGIQRVLPDEASRPSRMLRIKIVFYDGRRFSFGDPRMFGGSLAIGDGTKARDLPFSSLAMFYQGEPFVTDQFRAAHYESQTWLDPERTLADAGIGNGDHLVFAFGIGASEEISRLCALFSLAIEHSSNQDDPRKCIEIASHLFEAGRIKDAMERLVLAIEKHESNPVLWYYQGRCLQSMGRPEDALQSFRKAVDLNDKYAAAFVEIGLTLNNLGMHSEAISNLDRALEIDSSFASAWVNKGFALERLGDIDGALRCYEEALAQDSNCVEAWQNRGSVLVQKGLFAEAGKCFRKVLDLSRTEEVNHMARLGLALCREAHKSVS
jgi:tetratricopeptide (TPR) repeat protein